MRAVDLVPEKVELARLEVVGVVTDEVPTVAVDDLASRVGDDEGLACLVVLELVQRTIDLMGLDILELAVVREREEPAVRPGPRLRDLVVVREEEVVGVPVVGPDMDQISRHARDLHRITAVPGRELVRGLDAPVPLDDGCGRRAGGQRHRYQQRPEQAQPTTRARPGRLEQLAGDSHIEISSGLESRTTPRPTAAGCEANRRRICQEGVSQPWKVHDYRPEPLTAGTSPQQPAPARNKMRLPRRASWRRRPPASWAQSVRKGDRGRCQRVRMPPN